MPGPDPTARSDAADLAKFGYKQSLERRTGGFASFAVAFAFVSIATGIFTTYGAVLNSSGPVGIWTWPIAVLGQLAVAFVLGALAARIPVTGYHYQWMSRLANPVLGWILGWISFTFLAIVVVAVDYTIASTIFPVLLNYDGTATIAWVVTAIVLLIQALLVALSTPWAERVNNAFVSLELIGMVTLTVLLLVVAAVRGDMDFSNLFSKGAVPSDGPVGFWSFVTGLPPARGCWDSCWARSPSWGLSRRPTWPRRPTTPSGSSPGRCGRPCSRPASSASSSSLP